MSAGAFCPSDSTTKSPGTSSVAGIIFGCPSRITSAMGASMSRSASMARSARHSCVNPSTPFRTTMAMMATVSATSPNEAASAAAPNKIRIKGLWNWRKKIRNGDIVCPAAIRFSPYSIKRCAASALVSPKDAIGPPTGVALFCSECFKACAVSLLHHRMTGFQTESIQLLAAFGPDGRADDHFREMEYSGLP
jgi:hypothetical protein